MTTFRVTIRTPDTEVSVEADTLQNLRKGLTEIGIDERRVKDLLQTGTTEQGHSQRRNLGQAIAHSSGKIPENLIPKLDQMTNRDLVSALLFYESPVLTKKGMLSRSIELGRSLPPDWLDKTFARDMEGLIVKTETDDKKPAFKLSDQGRYKTEIRMKELMSGNAKVEK